MRNIYIAAHSKGAALRIRGAMKRLGHTIVNKWNGNTITASTLEEVEEADTVILTHNREGQGYFEAGYGRGAGHDLTIVGPMQGVNSFSPGVVYVKNVEELTKLLDEE